jgi:hypothetical protein
MSKNLEDNLNIDSVPAEPIRPAPREIVVSDETDDRRKELDKRKDYAEVRSNLKDIISTGMSAIDGILQVASEGESPRAYEVVSQLIKSVTEANKDLIGLHQQMKEINRDTGDSSQRASSITNNSIFVGSTKELQRLVKDNFKQLRDQSNVSE